MSIIVDTYNIAKKDLILEFRTKEFASVLIFSTLFALIEGITLDTKYMISNVSLWFILTFAIMLGLNSVFSREIKKNSIYSLLSLASKPQAIFLAKLVYLGVVLAVVETITFAVAIIFLEINIQGNLLLYFFILVCSSIDLAIAGCIVSFLTIYAKSKTLAIPILFFPLILPIILITGQAMENITFYYDPSAVIINCGLLLLHAIIMLVLILLFVEDLISE
ncbi:MAG: heme exporter protein CcmB [Candidatus Hodarchaeales archaeon]|jgi:ABC-type transport system involved in cytochrome c biogenesis permease component